MEQGSFPSMHSQKVNADLDLTENSSAPILESTPGAESLA